MAKATKNAAVSTPKSHKGFVNPYRGNGSYWTVCEVLARLGLNQFHHADELVKEFPKVMGAEKFKEFKGKEKRNEETGLEWSDKIILNANVVMRPDYGAALREIGHEVRKQKTEKGWEFGLFSSIAPKVARKAKAMKPPKAAAKATSKSKAVKAPKAKVAKPKAVKAK
jgi:hypothetical protein